MYKTAEGAARGKNAEGENFSADLGEGGDVRTGYNRARDNRIVLNSGRADRRLSTKSGEFVSDQGITLLNS